ncbi:heat shock protein 9/12-domain-containing protein [Russula dissimulans]|nr:heat shock protein 9/12-domain-containing protein [Russula dissimulans]
MSDQGRQSLAGKAGAALKPDSEKSTSEHIGDKLKGTADSIASKLQPEGQKSTGQQVGDKLSSGPGDENTPVVDKIKDGLSLGDRSNK